MKKDRWPVILEDSFRENVSQGWAVSVLCIETAKRSYSSWTGKWQVFCVSPDGQERELLVLRKNIEPRVILTSHGVTSFLMDLGITVSVVPMLEGQTIEITPPDKKILVGAL